MKIHQFSLYGSIKALSIPRARGRSGEVYSHFLRRDPCLSFLLVDKRNNQQVISADIYALAESEPYPNPLPKDHAEYQRYQNRKIYRQYSPHIGYESLLGYAHVKQDEDSLAGKIQDSRGSHAASVGEGSVVCGVKKGGRVTLTVHSYG